MEGRRPAKGNAPKTSALRTQRRVGAPSGLRGVREAARRDRRARFTALLHHVTVARLRESFYALKREAAPGVDGVTWAQYEADLDRNLTDLHGRVHRGTYRAKPSRRVYIPKADGRQRPLGIASLEDKVVQHAVGTVLGAVFEADFLGYSYGFRPGRSQHDALDALSVALMRGVNWVLDVDIRAFFDTISHGWLLKFIEHRIADRRVLRLIRKWLRAGVQEGGDWSRTEVGTPQGAVISPLLANVYLHYVLDLWVKSWRRNCATGNVVVVRYADDFVLGFQHRADAERLLVELRDRLARFSLALSPDKTRLIEFGRFAARNREGRGEGKPETFNFLGFTHRCGKTFKGKFVVWRRTIGKRLRAKLREVREELMRRRQEAVPEQGRWLRSVVQGFDNYHAVPGNRYALQAFRKEAAKAWLHALRRRSQTARALTWDRMRRYTDRWIPVDRTLHPYPWERFAAKHPRQEPDAVVPPVRIRAGDEP